MGVAERRAREREALRSKILDAATQLFIEEGIHNVSLRKIAERIEYSPATIYLYFRDKQDLLASVCQETFSQMKAELEIIEETVAEPAQRLRRGLRFYIDFGLAHPSQYQLTFGTPCEKESENPEVQKANSIGLETFDCLRRSLRRCHDSGIIAFDDLEAAGQVIWTFIHGLTSLVILYYDDPCFPWVNKETLIETGLDLILKGLQAGNLSAVKVGAAV